MLRDLFSLFPAYAGVIPGDGNGGGCILAFPRICGGDPNVNFATEYDKRFSPHMRG